VIRTSAVSRLPALSGRASGLNPNIGALTRPILDGRTQAASSRIDAPHVQPPELSRGLRSTRRPEELKAVQQPVLTVGSREVANLTEVHRVPVKHPPSANTVPATSPDVAIRWAEHEIASERQKDHDTKPGDGADFLQGSRIIGEQATLVKTSPLSRNQRRRRISRRSAAAGLGHYRAQPLELGVRAPEEMLTRQP
jgi:hypothetical protein